MNLTKNFSKSEFECNCGCDMPDDVLLEITKLASQHILGKAADIQISDMEPAEVYNTIDNLAGHGHILQGGLGKYNSFVHYDIRKTKVRWDKTLE